jgi:hypothetical protein
MIVSSFDPLHDCQMLMGFSIPIKFSTFEFSNNKFLKKNMYINKKILNLFAIPKLTCTQIAHNFKKNIDETKMFSCFQ